MNFLLLDQPMNKRWLAAPLLMLGGLTTGFLCSFPTQANATPRDQTPLLVAQAKCTAADRSNSSPPFRCVTPNAFSCLKRNNTGGGGSLEYRGDTSGEIVVRSNVVGTVALLGFSFNASSETLNLSVKQKSFGVQDQQIWNGFKSTLSKCR